MALPLVACGSLTGCWLGVQGAARTVNAVNPSSIAASGVGQGLEQAGNTVKYGNREEDLPEDLRVGSALGANKCDQKKEEKKKEVLKNTMNDTSKSLTRPPVTHKPGGC